VSRASIAPGRRSIAGLAWLARVGASPLEPWGLVMGWGRAVAYDHARRLAAAGLVRTVPMTRGDGSLMVITAQGAVMARCPATRARQAVAPTTWAHHCACAWVSAWLEVRGHAWWSEREIAEDEWWRYDVNYQDRRGTVRVTHRPDLAVQIAPGPVAIEVELQRKVRARLVGILRMYEEQTQDDGTLAGVIYVCDRHDVADAVRRAADDAWLEAPALSFRTIHEVVEQTRAAAMASPTRRAPR
jgi:hypothetical protein